MATRMQQRRGTASQWTTANPVLAAGEIGFESDTNQFKIGDGVNTWANLSYFVDSSSISGSLSDYVEITSLGVADGVATLDSTGNVPSSQLGNVPPVDLTGYATETYVNTAVNNLIDSAPELLNTLDELAAALNDDANFATTVNTAIAGKADAVHSHVLTDVTDITATAAELNVLDGITATTTELNYTDGVTSSIQTQLNGKEATITGAATTITSSNLTASRALVSDGSGKVAVSAVTSTEIGYLDGVTSAVQTQLNNKKTEISQAVSSNITLVAGYRYFVNTTAARTLTLPASPALGAEVQIFDANGLAGTNNITVNRNGQKINNVADNALLDVNGVAAVFVYTGSTYGWRMG